MFRKPKKKPAALRGGIVATNVTDNHDDDDDNDNNQLLSSSKKRRRPRKGSSSSEEETSDQEGGGEGTSDLLQQIRHERDASKSNKKSTSALLNTASTFSGGSNKKAKDWMHKYKSNDTQMSAQENATRTAEYHPSEAKGESTNEAMHINASISALQTNQPTNKFHAGPLRATTFVRTTARFDYQPDICKDYKETGFCGFGDTCIYLHDRGDTKSGWQMEQEYEEKKKRDEVRKGVEMEKFMNSMGNGGSGTGRDDGALGNDANGNQGKEDNDGLPFACHICRGPFQNPIVTTCAHYFCEKCMLQKIQGGSMGCPICQKDTHGVLNFPQKLVAKKRRLVGRDGTWEEYMAMIGGGAGNEEEE